MIYDIFFKYDSNRVSSKLFMERQSIVYYKEVTILQGGMEVLSSIDLSISGGEFYYLIGKTGSGKSSLLKSIYAALPVVSGLAMVSGMNVNELDRKQIPYLRRKLGMVFQDFNLLEDRTVAQNLEFVLKATGWKKKERLNRITEVLTEVGLADKLKRMPSQLSGGERQRVAIARALLNKPDLIIADEPTGNLDPETSDEIMYLFHRLNKLGTAILLATHDYRIIDKFPGMILKCQDGKIDKLADLQ